MPHLLKTLFSWILICALLCSPSGVLFAQGGDEDAFIAELFQSMSSDVRIGQLFVVAFEGSDVSSASDITDLILNYYVGGVILSPEHGNIINLGPETPIQVAQLNALLQQQAQLATPFIPLFIALQQDGGGPPYSSITSGLTPLPSQMAIGATWDRARAEAVGQIVGSELSALGFNMLLGPSLDLLTQPDVDGADEAGVRSFGGDPYWVGTLAAAYVRGVRQASNGRIAVVPKHWPGQGGLSRDSDQIDQSFDQLQRIDLLPYYNLMRVPEGSVRPWADAVLTTHARYRGFRGLRERTDPISVDSEALNALLELPSISQWRASGGLIVSGSLGDERLRQFYEAANRPVEQIALDSFLAGNDLLILNNFASTTPQRTEADNVRSTIELFRQRYREDLEFQDRVDSAVKRILRLKYRLYPQFSTLDVIVDPSNLNDVLGNGLPVLEDLAHDALTRLYPSDAQIAQQPLPVPNPDDNFLIFTDTRLIVDCPDSNDLCPARATLTTDAISQTLIALGNIAPEQITSLSFFELKPFVLGAEDAPDLSDAFAQADWIILGHQNLQPDIAQSDAARLLLRTRPDLIEGKNVVLFSFGPPYEWTADDLSRLTAAYTLYSIHMPFVEAAVRALLGELDPLGASPVNIPAIDYDLTRQTEPDPDQVIDILLEIPQPIIDPLTPVPPEDTATPAPPVFREDDTIRIRTGVIFDHNGNPVPDGTPVQFQLTFRGLQETSSAQETVTTNGWAAIDYTIPELGLLEVRAISEPATESNTLRLTITETSTSIQTVVPPAVSPTPTSTTTPTRVFTPTPTPTPVPFVDQIFDPSTRRVTVIDFMLALFGIVLVSAWGYRGESKRSDEGAIDRAVRLVLWGALAGLLAYAYYGLGLPGSDTIREALGNWAALVVTLVVATLPWLLERLRRGSG